MNSDSGRQIVQQAIYADAGPPAAIGYPSNSGQRATGWGGDDVVKGEVVQAQAYGEPVQAYPAQAYPAAPAQAYVSPASGNAASHAHGPINTQFFVEYANTVKAIESLEYVQSALQTCNGKIDSSRRTIAEMDQKLAKARVDQPKLEERIHRNEHPRFLHYMQFNRQEKVTKLKTTLENMITCQKQWTDSKRGAEQTLQSQLSEKQVLTNNSASRDSLQQKQVQMYEKTVTSVHPTPRLQQIDSNLNAQTAAAMSEQALLTAVDTVIALVREAQTLYGRSLNMLRQAMQANRTAQVVNVMDMGDRRPDYFERMEQMRRDRLINESQQPAIEAYMRIDRAWAAFPPEARARYPQLSAQIGQTPMPRLRGANFAGTMVTGMVFGDVGDMMNDARAAGKIRENEQIIMQCNHIVEVQVQLVTALRNAIAANVSAMQNQVNVLHNQRKQERDSIFETVRARTLNSFPQASAW